MQGSVPHISETRLLVLSNLEVKSKKEKTQKYSCLQALKDYASIFQSDFNLFASCQLHAICHSQDSISQKRHLAS